MRMLILCLLSVFTSFPAIRAEEVIGTIQSISIAESKIVVLTDPKVDRTFLVDDKTRITADKVRGNKRASISLKDLRVGDVVALPFQNTMSYIVRLRKDPRSKE